MKRWIGYGLIVCILSSFCLLAFQQITSQGLLYHDSGLYLLEAKFLDEGFHRLLSLDRQDFAQTGFWEDIKTTTSGVPLHVAKPGYTFILWAAGAIAGFSDSVLPVLTAIFAVFGLFLTFVIARRLGGLPSALYATAFLASSVFYLVYARSGFADQVATALFLLGIFFYLRAEDSKPLLHHYLTGLCLGYAFCVNQWRSAYMLGLVILLVCLRSLVKRVGWKNFIQYIGLSLFGIATPLVAFQIPYGVATIVLGSLPASIPSYWTQLQEQLAKTSALTWFNDMGEMSRMFWQIEGPLFSTLVLVAWIFLVLRLVIKRRLKDMLLVFFSLLPFVYFSLMKAGGETFPRMVSSLLPIAAICVGETFWALQSYLAAKSATIRNIPNFLAAAIALGFWALLIPHVAQGGITRSGYADASRFLRATGQKKLMILGMEPVWRFYLGRVAFEPYARPTTMSALVERALAQDIPYVIVDFSTLYSKYGCQYTSKLIGHLAPVATFANPRGNSLAYLADIFGFEKACVVAQDPSAGMIYVFSIRDIANFLGSLKT